MLEMKKFLVGLRSFVRRYWMCYSEERKAVIAKNKVVVSKRNVNFRCEICGEQVKQKMFRVHHILPIGTLTLETFPKFLQDLFCEEGKLVGVCDDCHKELHSRMKKETNVETILQKINDSIDQKERQFAIIIAKYLLYSAPNIKLSKKYLAIRKKYIDK